VVASRQRFDDPLARLASWETVEGVEVYRVRTSRFRRHFLPGRAVDYLTFYLSASFRLWRLALRGDVVVAKTDPPLVSVVTGWVCRLRGAELANWLQDLFPEVAVELGIRGLDGWPGRFLRRLRNASLKRACVNVVPGERMAGRLLDEGVAEDRIRVIHNWADGEAIRPVPATENPLRVEWGLSERFVFGYSGNLGRAHEFENMLGAIRRLRAREDIVFLFIGGEPKSAAFREAVEREGFGIVLFRSLPAP
jgi:glycosyltransferase involved in cell wall biosynthesis